jgi:hypothetical protein
VAAIQCETDGDGEPAVFQSAMYAQPSSRVLYFVPVLKPDCVDRTGLAHQRTCALALLVSVDAMNSSTHNARMWAAPTPSSPQLARLWMIIVDEARAARLPVNNIFKLLELVMLTTLMMLLPNSSVFDCFLATSAAVAATVADAVSHQAANSMLVVKISKGIEPYTRAT